MNIHKRRTPEEAVNHAWLEKVAGEMLADSAWQATRAEPLAVVCAVDDDGPGSDRRRTRQHKPKIARDGYGRPLRQAPVPSEAADGPVAPRTGHPLGIAGKVLLGAALTGVGMGLASGLAAAEPLAGDTTPTPESRPALRSDVRVLTDRELGSELGRVSGKDSLRAQEVVTEMKLRGMQLFEAPPDNRIAVQQQLPAAEADVTRPTVKVVVVGDSFTSGEGASSSTYRRVPVPYTTQDNITFETLEIDPAHQSSTAPTLQALGRIQAANPGADIQVTFVPVSGATRDSLYNTTKPGTPFEQAPQINAVKGADVVIVGIGGNDARFSDWVKTALSNTDSSSAQQFPQFMQQLNDGTYLDNQTKLLNDISGMASPSATIVSLGYPKALPSAVPGTPTWYSPFSWSTISQGEADRSNQLATTLNTNNQAASAVAASQHPAQTWLYADVASALQGHELLSKQEGLNGLDLSNVQGSYHPNDLGQRLLGSVLQPYVEQAVNNQLARYGVQGAENVPPADSSFANQWNLRVDVPLQMQNQQQQPAQPAPAEPAPAQPNGAAPADPNADTDGDGIPNGQDQTWNENNTDPTSTDVGDGPEGNPGYADADAGSGNFNGTLDPASRSISGSSENGSGTVDPASVDPATGTSDPGTADNGANVEQGAAPDAGTNGGGVDPGTGFSDSGFGNNGGGADSAGGSSGSGNPDSSGGLSNTGLGGTDPSGSLPDSGLANTDPTGGLSNTGLGNTDPTGGCRTRASAAPTPAADSRTPAASTPAAGSPTPDSATPAASTPAAGSRTPGSATPAASTPAADSRTPAASTPAAGSRTPDSATPVAASTPASAARAASTRAAPAAASRIPASAARAGSAPAVPAGSTRAVPAASTRAARAASTRAVPAGSTPVAPAASVATAAVVSAAVTAAAASAAAMAAAASDPEEPAGHGPGAPTQAVGAVPPARRARCSAARFAAFRSPTVTRRTSAARRPTAKRTLRSWPPVARNGSS